MSGRSPWDDVPCGYVVFGSDLAIREANVEFERMVGRDRPGLSIFDVLTVAGRMYFETHVLPILETEGSVREVALDVRRPDGSRLPVLLNARRTGGLVHAVLVELRDRRRFEDDLRVATRAAERARDAATQMARALQDTLIPPSPPAVPHLDIAASYRPAGDGSEIGGDFYDVFQLGASEWVVALGDVSGKGVPAAVVTSFVRHAVRGLTVQERDPAVVLGQVDRALRGHPTEHFCTLVLARFERIAGRWRVDLALAGHPPPLLRRGDEVTELGHYGSVLGLVDRPAFETVTHDLEGTLTFFTDGITEARGPDGLLGDDRLVEVVRAAAPDPASLTRAVVDAALDFQDGVASDDIAVVTVAPVP